MFSIRSTLTWDRLGWFLFALVGLMFLGFRAYRKAVAAPDSGGVINACVTRIEPGDKHDNGQGKGDEGGLVHIVPAGTPCPRGEQALAWNVQGPPGQPGPDSIAKLENVHCPPGQFVNSFAGDGTPICQPALSPAGSAVVGGGTDSLQDASTIGMFAWGNGGFVAGGSFLERYGVIPVAGTLANFTVDIQNKPAAGTNWTFSLVAATPDHNLVAIGPNCSIPAGKFECLASGSVAVQPGWTIFVIDSQGGGAANGGMASWGATFQPGP